MKAINTSRVIAAIAALLSLLSRPGVAAPAFVYETPGEFLASGDFNGDGVPDALVLDKITGNARVGYGDTNGNLTWSAPLVTGVANPTGCAIGRFLQIGRDGVAVTAPALNAVNLVDLSNANSAAAPVVVTPPGLGPHTVVPMANPLGVATPPSYNSLLTASSANTGSSELLDLMTINAGLGSAAGQYGENGSFERGNALQLTGTQPTFAAGLLRGSTDTLDIWQFTNAPAVMLSLSNLTSGIDYTFGNFNGEPLPRFIFYKRGGTNLTIVPLLQSGGIYSFGAPLATSVAQTIQGVFCLNQGANGCAMIQFTNGVEAMSLPGGVPAFASLYNSGAAAGDVFTGVVPLANGQFALFDSASGNSASIHGQVVRFDGTNYTQKSSSNLSAATSRGTRANVWLFQSEPFVNRQAGLIASLSAPDWSDSVSGLPGALSVRTETDAGSSGGLGSAAVTNLAAPPSGSVFGLANQYSSAISLFSYGSPQPAQPIIVNISPTPGLYSGPISISFTTSNVQDQVFYRVGAADSWHLYSASFTLTNDNTIQFYGTNATRLARSQLQSAAYSLGCRDDSGNTDGGTSTNAPTQTNPPPGSVLSSVGTLFYGRRSTNNNGTIWAVNLDGSDDTYITTGARPRASRDGLWLAFMREGDPFNNQGNLWLREMRSGAERRLLVNTNQIVCCDWEPDDSGLILDYGCGIWRLGTNGALTAIFTNSCYAQAPVLNPVDGRMAYQFLYMSTVSAAVPGLYVNSFNGSSSQRITTNVAGASWPQWSPDGTVLVCADGNSLGALDKGTNLWLVASDGSSANRVCDFSGTDNRFPHGALWTPDGGSVVGAATLYEVNGLWIVPLNSDRNDCGGDATLLPTTPGDPIDFAGSIAMPPSGKPVIVTQPVSAVVQQGQPASLSVTATGAAPLHYEWIKDGVLLPGQTSSSLHFSSFQLTNSGVYSVVVTNPLGLAIATPARFCLANAPLRGWGADYYGELADGGIVSAVYTNGVDTKTNVPQLMMNNVVASAEGSEFSMFVTANGDLWTVGNNSWGQLGAGSWYLTSYLGYYDQAWDATSHPVRVATNVVAVAAGAAHSLFLTADGNLWSMGYDADGQLGVVPPFLNNPLWSWFPPTDPSWNVYGATAAPQLVAGNVVSVAAGNSESLFVKADGTLWAMGDYHTTQFGGTDHYLPAMVAENVVLATTGVGYSLYVTADGNLWAMGENDQGQLGDGTTDFAWQPEMLASNVVAAAVGSEYYRFSLFLKADGTLWGMGWYNNVSSGTYPSLITSNVVSMTGLDDAYMFVKADGSLWAAGYDQWGIFDPVTNPWFNPVLVKGGGFMVSSLARGPDATTCLGVMGRLPMLASLTDLTVLPGQSFSFTAVVTNNGDGPTTLQWQLNGANLANATNGTISVTNATADNAGVYKVVAAGTYGSTSASANLFVNQAPIISVQPVSAVVAAGQPASLSVGVKFTLPMTYEWMKDGVLLPGQTGSTLNIPSFQLTNSGAYQVVVSNAAGIGISVPALLTVPNAPLRAWGYNGFGQLGNGTTANTNLPVLVASNVVVEAVGNRHSLFVKADLTLWGMGDNGYGELGKGSLSSTNLPTMVTSNVVAVAAGTYHSLFLKADSTLWGMGYNWASYGQLGKGTLYSTNQPVMITSNVVAVAAGDSHSMYVKADGTLWTMGLNGEGQLGLGTIPYTNLPVMVASNVVSVAAGMDHSLFMKADGSLWGMGDNSFGELGDSTYNNTNRPEMLASNVVAVAAGDYHSVYVKADLTLWGMGNSQSGELGFTSPYRTNQAVMVASNAVTVASGQDQYLFLKTDGTAWGIGQNSYGSLGNGTSTDSHSPALVNGSGLVGASLAKGPMAWHGLAVAGALPVINPLANQTVLPGQPFSFAAVVSGGDGPFTGYQWQLNGAAISGATNTAYSVASASPGDAGNYTVVVTGVWGNGSASGALKVNLAPIITSQPAGVVAGLGQSVSASVTVSGLLTPVAYEWIKDGVLLPSQTSATLNIPSFQFTNCGAYQVVISNAAGIAVSRPALLSLPNAPLRVWGYNAQSQLGDGTTSNTNRPEMVASNVVVEASGAIHSLFVKADGTLWGMGNNGYGQLGDGTYNNTNRSKMLTNNVVAVAAGQSHSLFLKADGSLWGAGYNNYGQLGNGANANTNRPVMIATNVASVAAGQNHSLYVTADGTLWSMGYNYYGQLGIGSTTDTNRPVMVATNVVAAAAGANHSLYMTVDGTLWGMGYNGLGQLGNGTYNNATLPVALATNVVTASAGYYFSIYLTADGTLWGTGANPYGQFANGTLSVTNRPVAVAANVVMASAGQQHTLFLKTDGSLWGLGYNANGELGNGTLSSTSSPTLVNGPGFMAATLARGPMADQSMAVAVTNGPVVTVYSNQVVNAGQSFNFSATVTGGDGPFSYQWQLNGANISGATGSAYSGSNAGAGSAGTYTIVATGAYASGSASATLVVKFLPTITRQPTGSVVALGQPASVSVTASSLSTPLTYKWIKDGMLLPGQTNATLSFDSFQLTNSGAYQVVATNADGIAISIPALLTVANAPLRGWGNNTSGQLGDGTFNNDLVPEPMAANVVVAAAGAYTSLYVTANGNLWGMGDNYYGELGLGAIYSASQPTLVATNVVAAAAGSMHSLFVTAEGKLWAMGGNYSGQLGTGANATTNRPVLIATNVVAIAAGQNHSLYLTADGILWSMGANLWGQLGNGANADTNRPMAVAFNVVTIAAGGTHSLYVTANGSLWGMGYNQYGALGNGTFVNTNRPVWVTNNVVAVAAGSSHSLFVTADANLWGMGFNSSGELGVGISGAKNRPVLVAANVVAASAGQDHSLYVKPDGSLWVTGNNSFGQLGNNSLNASPVPVQVNGGDMVTASLARGAGANHTLVIAGAAPFVVSLPDQTVPVGKPFSFSPVFSRGDAGSTYQWQLNGANIPGATSASYNVASAAMSDAGVYTLSTAGPFGGTSASSGANLTVFVLRPPPAITQQPVGATVSAGQSASLSVTATSDTPLTYEWIKDGVLLPGQTNSALNFGSFQIINCGAYQVVVSNAAGITISRPVLLSQANAPLQVWGDNGYGQLGDGTYNDSSLPETVAANAVVEAAGQNHSLYVTADGTLWAMGLNSDGQLGDGGLEYNASLPVIVASNVVAAAAGQSHSLYVTTDGTLWAMGYNGYGQLGNGTWNDAFTPAAVATNVVAVTAGADHSLYLTADGTLWAMGYDNDGQLGDGLLWSTAVLPKAVATNVVTIAAGGYHSLYVTADGTLWAMGNNGNGELGNGGYGGQSQPEIVASNVVAVAAGEKHSLYLTADGGLWAMGDNSVGQLGDGGLEYSAPLPVMVASNVAAVAAGDTHSLFVTADGKLWAMGYNVYGQLGDGSQDNTNQPALVIGNGLATASLAKGPMAYHSMAVVAKMNYAPIITSQPAGSVTGIGQPASTSVTASSPLTPVAYEWIKDGILLPSQTTATLSFDSFQLTNCGAYQVVVSNAAGIAISAPALLTVPNAPLRAWGCNNYGQLGDNSISFSVGLPERVAANVVAEAAGSRHSLYVTADGTLWAMGGNDIGQLGDGTWNETPQPEAVATNVVAVAAGQSHSLYLTADRTLWGMGDNSYGQLGLGALSYTLQPVAVASNVVAIAAGGYHSLFVTADGGLWAMGNNAEGELGDGGNSTHYQPEMVASNVVTIAAGEKHSLYVTVDGTFWAMGDNTVGELGDGGLETSARLPVTVASNVVAIAAGGYPSPSYGVGGYHSLYVTADGTLWAMGYNGDGELGNGTYNGANLPVMVTGNVVAVSAGCAHSLFVTSDGSLWAMGDNSFLELGDNSWSGSAVPTLVNWGGMLTASLAKGESASHALAVAGMAPQAYVPNQTLLRSQPFTLSAVVYGGDGPFTYQWQYNWVKIAGATASTYAGTNAGTNDTWAYTVVVTGAYGSSVAWAYLNFVPVANTTNTLTATPATLILPGTDVLLTNKVGVVAPGTGIPTGTVTFLTNGVAFVTKNLDGGAMAKTDVVLRQHGYNTITVRYSGDPNFNPSTNTLTLVVDNPPVPAATCAVGTLKNQPLTLPVATLLSLATDADGDPLSIPSVSSPSSHGAVSLSGGKILYTPATNYTGSDTITYSLFDTFQSVPGAISVTVTNNNIGPIKFVSTVVNAGGSVTLKYTATPNTTCHVQVAGNLSAAPIQWLDLADSTNTVSSDGTLIYTDTHTGGARQRFYRALSP